MIDNSLKIQAPTSYWR